MIPVLFTDLDDTLFQTARKMASEPEDALLASRALNGSHSYMSRPQKAMFDWLSASTRLIPVTARSTEALARCTLEFRDYRVCSNGGIILGPDGRVDRAWMTRTRDVAETFARPLARLKEAVAELNHDDRLRHWIVEEQGCPIYLCVKSNGGEDALDEVQDGLRAVAGPALKVHRNGNNLSFTPSPISKRAAVEYLIDEIGGGDSMPVWGMGDSLTDLPFMEACQMMVIPTGSQLHKSGQASSGGAA